MEPDQAKNAEEKFPASKKYNTKPASSRHLIYTLFKVGDAGHRLAKDPKLPVDFFSQPGAWILGRPLQ